MNKKNATPSPAQSGESNDTSKITDISTSAQRFRLLQALQLGPVTTLKARCALNVLHPAARVQELRNKGYTILTNWTIDTTNEGHPHRVAQYLLIRKDKPSEDAVSNCPDQAPTGDLFNE